ncbi:MAG TPA: formate--tetrahydrofolate ligase, partial [Methanocorpusculum sp.]|nr:formate--tetrahydrofolate ligase [Methanocorpusculum sp.]
EDTAKPNVEAMKKGMVNLEAHIENLKKFGVPIVVAINRFAADSDEELKVLEEKCKSLGADFALSEVFAKGGDGGIDLATKVVAACEKPSNFKCLYDIEKPIKEKLEIIAKEIYGADGVVYSAQAESAIKDIEALGRANLPICVAKTQYSLSDDPNKLGRPKGFKINAATVRLCNGAGFIVVETGDIMTMPGLPLVPAACGIDVDNNGKISGLF